MKPTTALSRNPGQDRQASLISSAAALFAAKGFKGTTTKAIARAAGVSEALVFKYFPTKRALYTAILAEKAPLSELLHAVEEVARKTRRRPCPHPPAGNPGSPGKGTPDAGPRGPNTPSHTPG